MPVVLTAQPNRLPFRLTARQLFHLRFFRSARIVAGLLRLFRFALLAGGSLALLPLFLSQLCCVCHDYA
jgi:hypothetical protein